MHLPKEKDTNPVAFLEKFNGGVFDRSRSKIIIAAFQDIKDGVRRGYHGWHTSMKVDKVWKEINVANSQDCGIFFTVNFLLPKLDKGANKKRTKKMVVGCRAIWCEDDSPRDGIRSDWPIAPSIIVESSPGKYHYYWLTWTTNTSQWEEVMMKMVTDHGSDPNARDLVRVLRLPGTYHCKRDPKWMVKIVGGNEEHYEWKDVVKAFGTATEEDLIKFRKIESDKRNEKNSAVGEPGSSGSSGSVVQKGEIITDSGVRDYKREIITGVNMHGAFLGLSLGYANKGMTEKAIYAVLEAVYDAAKIAGIMDETRLIDLEREWADVSRTIQTALYKVNGENDEKMSSLSSQTHSEFEEIKSNILTIQSNALGERTNLEVPYRNEYGFDTRVMPKAGGLMGEFIKNTDDSARYPHDIISNAVPMTIIAGIVGRHFNITHGGLNIYTAILMNSGMGKAHIGKYINWVFSQADIFNIDPKDYICGGGFTGPKALARRLHKMGCGIGIFTEAGEIWKSKSGDMHRLKAMILNLITESGYNGTIIGSKYSSEEENQPDLVSCAFSAIYESIVESFEEGLMNRDSVKSGEFARMTVLKHKPFRNPQGQIVERHNPDAFFHINPAVLARLSKLIWICADDKDGSKRSNPIILIPNDKYRSYEKECREKMYEVDGTDDVKYAYYTRAAHKALRISAIIELMNCSDEELDEAVTHSEEQYSNSGSIAGAIADSAGLSGGAVGSDPMNGILKVSDESWNYALHYVGHEEYNLKNMFNTIEDDHSSIASLNIQPFIFKRHSEAANLVNYDKYVDREGVTRGRFIVNYEYAGRQGLEPSAKNVETKRRNLILNSLRYFRMADLNNALKKKLSKYSNKTSQRQISGLEVMLNTLYQEGSARRITGRALEAVYLKCGFPFRKRDEDEVLVEFYERFINPRHEID